MLVLFCLSVLLLMELKAYPFFSSFNPPKLYGSSLFPLCVFRQCVPTVVRFSHSHGPAVEVLFVRAFHRDKLERSFYEGLNFNSSCPRYTDRQRDSAVCFSFFMPRSINNTLRLLLLGFESANLFFQRFSLFSLAISFSSCPLSNRLRRSVQTISGYEKAPRYMEKKKEHRSIIS